MATTMKFEPREETSVCNFFSEDKIKIEAPIYEAFGKFLTIIAKNYQVAEIENEGDLNGWLKDQEINEKTFDKNTLAEKMSLESSNSKLAIYFFKVKWCEITPPPPKKDGTDGKTYSYYKRQQDGESCDKYEERGVPYYLYIGKVTKTTIRQRLKEHLGFGHNKTGALRLNEGWIQFENLEIHILTFEPTGESEGEKLVDEIVIDALEKISIKLLKPIIGKS